MNKAKALYIHIPFCEHICTYCDFTKLQYFTYWIKPYLQSLEKEIKSLNIDETLKTIYIGGGTPTALEDRDFLRLFEIISPYCREVEEFTVEANPESLTQNKINIMKKFGVNRVSIGVESTNDKILKTLNRHHTFDMVKKAVSALQNYGIDNYNLDLIIGLPHTNITQIKKDLFNIISLNPKHISVYSLSINKNTVMHNSGLKEKSNDLIRKYYDLVSTILSENGYVHYEISNWAKPGHYSKHNLTYWRNEHYYGVGLGASGYIDNFRYVNTKNILEYNKGNFLKEKEVLSKKDLYNYYLMTNLRTIEGLDIDLVNKESGVNLLTEKRVILDSLINKNLIYINNNHVIPTYEGMMILDSIILELM